VRPRLDLNLVFVAESLYRHQNVSRAAKELQVTQSAVSHALAKLREHFQDPLFVRVSKGVAPTDAAKALRASIEELAEKGRELSRRHDAPDPKRVQGRLTLATTDYVEVLLMPRLLPRLRREAPGLQVSLRPTGGELPKAELESGAFDIACAGFYKNLPEGFFQTKLFEDGFAVGCRKGHPLGKEPLTRERFFAADHALITLQGDFKTAGVERGRARSREQNVVFGSYSFTGMAWTLASTDLLLSAPRRLLEKYREHFPIEILESPVSRPKLEIRMIWHALTHRDPLKKWLRGVLKEELSAI
jgi:DNA-binding transcriptional LysR family regulator